MEYEKHFLIILLVHLYSQIPHSHEQFREINTDVLKLAKGNIYHSFTQFISSFEARWRNDEHVILIMSAILMFSPDRPKVVHRDVIKLEQVLCPAHPGLNQPGT